MINNTVSDDSTTSIVKCAFYRRSANRYEGPSAIEAQLDACREYAESKGWTLLANHVYVEEGRAGASHYDRPVLKKLLASAKSASQPFTRLLCADTSRVGHDLEPVYR